MAILVLCLKPQNLLDPNVAFASFGNRLTISPVVERLVFSKVQKLGGRACWPVHSILLTALDCNNGQTLFALSSRAYARQLHLCDLQSSSEIVL